jgi:hypothetical protein
MEASEEALSEARALTAQQASRLSHLESEFEALQVGGWVLAGAVCVRTSVTQSWLECVRECDSGRVQRARAKTSSLVPRIWGLPGRADGFRAAGVISGDAGGWRGLVQSVCADALVLSQVLVGRGCRSPQIIQCVHSATPLRCPCAALVCVVLCKRPAGGDGRG